MNNDAHAGAPPLKAPGLRPPVVRQMVDSDLPFVDAEHQASLPHGLYARLGPRFLRRYHAVYVHSAGAVALLAEQDGRPVGFLTGSLPPPLTGITLKRAVPALTVIGTAALLKRPALLRRVLSTNAGSYPRRVRRILRRNQPDSQPNCPAGVLTYLAVSPEALGQAVGDTPCAASSSVRHRQVVAEW